MHDTCSLTDSTIGINQWIWIQISDYSPESQKSTTLWCIILADTD